MQHCIDYALPKRHIATLEVLPQNNIIITPSDKNGGVVITDITQ